MSDIRRFKNKIVMDESGPHDRLMEDKQGDWIQFADYNALAAELAAKDKRLAELEAERTGTIHESWQHKTHAEVLEGLKWQGAITKSLLASNDELQTRLAEAVECCTIKDNRNLRLEIALRQAMNDTPGWYDLARDALAYRGARATDSAATPKRFVSAKQIFDHYGATDSAVTR